MGAIDAAPVGTLARGLRVLSCVARSGLPVGVTELAQRAELDKATTYRLAGKLVELGYLERDRDGKFKLGLHVLDLGFAFLASFDVRTQALPEMRRLREELDGTISLSVLDGTDVVYIERFAAKRLQASMPVGIGARLPAHVTAMGKAILAYLPPEELAAVLDRIVFERWTARTIHDRAALLADLAATRERGFGVTEGETIDGLRAAAAPIFGPEGRPIAGVSVAISAYTSTVEELLTVVGPRLIRAGRTISAHLGGAGNSTTTLSFQPIKHRSNS